jgi:hypothetical protein
MTLKETVEEVSSRLRKKGCPDLDSLQAPRFCDSGKSFAWIRWWPADLFRAREHTATFA